MYERTTTARQGDTLDAIAYRFFGTDSGRFLSAMIEHNPKFCPIAVLPFGAVIVLPNIKATPTAATVKLWD